MSGGSSKSRSRNEQNVWQNQAPYLQDLFQQGQQNLPNARQRTEQLMGEAMPVWQGMLNPNLNPYARQMAQTGLDQMNQNFSENVLPNIQRQAIGGMNLGGSRQGIAEGMAAQGLQEQQAKYLNNFYGGQYQADQQRALQALGMLPALQQMNWADLQGYAGLIGSPTTLGRGRSNSKAWHAGVL